MSIADGFNLWVGRVLAELAIVGVVFGIFAVVVVVCAVFGGRK